MLLQLASALRRFRPHIAWASQFGDLAFAAPAGRACGALVLGGIRSDGLYELRTSGKRRRFLLWGAHGLIANSHRAKANLVAAGVEPRKITVLPNVIDLAEFDRRAALPLPGSAPAGRTQLTAVGSLHECKRLDRFLDALALARRSQPALYGVIAGADLGARTTLERRASELGLLPAHLRFLGEVDQVPALLTQSRLLVLCSEYEGFPNVILEAMAARRPVLTTSVGDAGLIVEHGTTGYVFAPDHVTGLAEGMTRLGSNPQLCQHLGDCGRKRVEQHYNVSGLAERLLRLFSDFARQQGKHAVLDWLSVRGGGSDSGIRPVPSAAAPIAVT
jgi:glycosyltransferase involved in cell wall biosynthesis